MSQFAGNVASVEDYDDSANQVVTGTSRYAVADSSGPGHQPNHYPLEVDRPYRPFTTANDSSPYWFPPPPHSQNRPFPTGQPLNMASERDRAMQSHPEPPYRDIPPPEQHPPPQAPVEPHLGHAAPNALVPTVDGVPMRAPDAPPIEIPRKGKAKRSRNKPRCSEDRPEYYGIDTSVASDSLYHSIAPSSPPFDRNVMESRMSRRPKTGWYERPLIGGGPVGTPNSLFAQHSRLPRPTTRGLLEECDRYLSSDPAALRASRALMMRENELPEPLFHQQTYHQGPSADLRRSGAPNSHPQAGKLHRSAILPGGHEEREESTNLHGLVILGNTNPNPAPQTAYNQSPGPSHIARQERPIQLPSPPNCHNTQFQGQGYGQLSYQAESPATQAYIPSSPTCAGNNEPNPHGLIVLSGGNDNKDYPDSHPPSAQNTRKLPYNHSINPPVQQNSMSNPIPEMGSLSIGDHDRYRNAPQPSTQGNYRQNSAPGGPNTPKCYSLDGKYHPPRQQTDYHGPTDYENKQDPRQEREQYHDGGSSPYDKGNTGRNRPPAPAAASSAYHYDERHDTSANYVERDGPAPAYGDSGSYRQGWGAADGTKYQAMGWDSYSGHAMNKNNHPPGVIQLSPQNMGPDRHGWQPSESNAHATEAILLSPRGDAQPSQAGGRTPYQEQVERSYASPNTTYRPESLHLASTWSSHQPNDNDGRLPVDHPFLRFKDTALQKTLRMFSTLQKQIEGPDGRSVFENCLFSCPFSSVDPVRYRDCYIHNLTTIRDVKQHLFRYHNMPIYCARCFTTFNEEKDRDEHVRNAVCPARPWERVDGVTEAQRRQLAKKAPPGVLEINQWLQAYAILFPESDPRAASPYVNAALARDLVNFRSFMKRHGQRIIWETLTQNGSLTWNLPNEERDLAAFRRMILEDGAKSLFDGWADHVGLQTAPTRYSTSTDSSLVSSIGASQSLGTSSMSSYASGPYKSGSYGSGSYEAGSWDRGMDRWSDSGKGEGMYMGRRESFRGASGDWI